MWPRRSNIVAPLTEADRGPKDRKNVKGRSRKFFYRNEAYGICRDSVKIPRRTIPFIVHIDASDKQLDDVIRKKKKNIAFILIRFIKP